MITDAELSKIEARAANATPGPWEWWTSCSWRRLSSRAQGKHPRDGRPISQEGGVICPAVNSSDHHPDLIVREQDMEFIAASRDDVPRLIEEVRRLRALVAGHEECAASSRRLAREIDVAMNGEAGAARQASLCDLVDSARQLRAANAIMHEALTEIAEEIDAGRHDGLPEPAPAHDADVMFYIARTALSEPRT